MARSAAQIRAQIRQAQQRQQQAVRKYNDAVRKYKTDRRQAIANANRAIDNHNSAVRRQNAARRTQLARLQRELQRLASRPNSASRTVTVRTSVHSVVRHYQVLEHTADRGELDGAWLDLSEREAANSVEVYNVLLDDVSAADMGDGEVAGLQTSGIGLELQRVGGDLDARWNGALFALNPRNPDATRHFTTSAREMLGMMLELVAPDDAVLTANPNCPRTDRGDVSRRARIHYCLARQGHDTDELADFVEADVDNVVHLFAEFNSGTHGSAGKFPVAQLAGLKRRVEDAVRFVSAIAFGIDPA